jgi:paraquat-inducible protein A
MHQNHIPPPDPPQDMHRLVACEHCDALHMRVTLQPGERATCLRCGGALYRNSSLAYRRLLPLVVTALILFMISNAYPIVAMELKGSRVETTLWGAVQALYAHDMSPVALLVFATTILLPLAELLMMCYLLVPMAQFLSGTGLTLVGKKSAVYDRCGVEPAVRLYCRGDHGSGPAAQAQRGPLKRANSSYLSIFIE